jgi:hypothetical protein
MFPWLVAGTAVAAGSVALVTSWLFKRPEAVEYTVEGSESCFSPERYERMNRLLSPEDIEFLRSRPGITREAIRKFESDRYRIFRLYLKELAADFESLHAQARRLVAEAPQEHAPLVGLLMKQQIRFRAALAGVHFRLALHQTGWGAVDLRGVLAPVQALQQVLEDAA